MKPAKVFSPSTANAFESGSSTPILMGSAARGAPGNSPAPSPAAAVVVMNRRRFIESSSRESGVWTSGGAEEPRLDLVIAAQGLGRTLELDPALVEHVAAGRERERHLELLLHEQDGDAVPVDSLENLHQGVDQHRHEPAGQLVDQHQARAGQEAAGEREHLLLAAGEILPRLVEALAEARGG